MIDLSAYGGIVFVSDVHLGIKGYDNGKIESSLISLIEHCASENLYLSIHGDLFDYWMEYPKRNFVPNHGAKLLDAFEKYNRTVASALFIPGNHDHWTFGHFEERGFLLPGEFAEIKIDENKVLVLHGDGLSDAKWNLPLPWLHRTLKSEGFINAYQAMLPPAIGLRLMKYFSFINQQFPEDTREVLTNWADSTLRDYDFNVIISGHDHIARSETLSYGTHINSGAYYKDQTVVLYKNNAFDLVTWNAEKQEFDLYQHN